MVRVVYLGVADSIPSSGRNHVSILISSGSENILVDCGEGTQRQIRKAKVNPCKITKILITHWHGDHVLGLAGLLSTLALSGYNRKLSVYGPIGTKAKFFDMLNVFWFSRSYDIEYLEVESGVFYEDEEIRISSEKMEHGVNCVGYSFIKKGHLRIKKGVVEKVGSGPHLKKLKTGEDIVVSGEKFSFSDSVYKEDDVKISVILDTKFNSRIKGFVEGADLFICEGTYSDDLKDEADKHMHMTVGGAARLASDAKVSKLRVIHIGSRYLKNMKGLFDEAKKYFDDVYFPRDLDEEII